MKNWFISAALCGGLLLFPGDLWAQGKKYKSGLDVKSILSIGQTAYQKQHGVYASTLNDLLQFLQTAKVTNPNDGTVLLKELLLGEGEDVNILRFEPDINQLFSKSSLKAEPPLPPPPPSSETNQSLGKENLRQLRKTPVMLSHPFYSSKRTNSFELESIQRWADATVFTLKFFRYGNIDQISVDNSFYLIDQKSQQKYPVLSVLNIPYAPDRIQLNSVRGGELYFQLVFPSLPNMEKVDLHWPVNGGLDFYGIDVSALFGPTFEELPYLPQGVLSKHSLYRTSLTKQIPMNRYNTDYEFHDGMLAIYNSELGGYGFIDEQGNIRIKFEWEYLPFDKPCFGKGHCIVFKRSGNLPGYYTDHWYIIDKSGRITADLGTEISKTSGFNKDGYANVIVGSNKKGYRTMVIDTHGREVFPHLSYSGPSYSLSFILVTPFIEELAMYCDAKTHRYGYISRDGRIVIPAQYEYASNFSEGLAAVNFPAISGSRPALWGYIDKTGKTVIPPTFRAQPGDFSEDMAVVTKKNGKQVYMDRTGKISPKEWNSLTPIKIGHAIADGMYVIDRNQHIVRGPFLEGKIKITGEYKHGLYPCQVYGAQNGAIYPNGYLYPIQKIDHISENLIHYQDSWNHVDGFIDKNGRMVFEFVQSEF